MRYNIAGIITEMTPRFDRLRTQSKDYLYDGDRETNIIIDIDNQTLDEYLADAHGLDYSGAEYLIAGAQYYSGLISFYGMMLHSSCVVYKDKAYLFSAPCGTGKSTHTQLWLKRFPGAYILNDDKPAVRITDKGIYAFGTPFSGKTELNVNKGVPIGGICVLERAEKNSIKKIDTNEAIFCLLSQTVRPNNENKMDKLLTVLEHILAKVPVYKLCCNMELEAAEVAYNKMSAAERETL